jgi:hypothetical protein
MSEHTDKIKNLELQLENNRRILEMQSAEMRKLDAIIKGTRLVLAGLVHQVGGEVVLDEPTLRLMDSGNFTMSQTSQDDPVSVHIVVKEKPVAPDATEENEG